MAAGIRLEAEDIGNLLLQLACNQMLTVASDDRVEDPVH